MTLFDQVQQLVLKGHTTDEIVGMLPASTSRRTVIVYVSTIRRTMSGADRPKPASKAFRDRKTLSPLHVLIGVKLYVFRSGLRLGHEEFAVRFAFRNRTVVSAMEQGIYNFTLSDLQHISEVTQLSVKDLLDAYLLPRGPVPASQDPSPGAADQPPG